MNKRAAREGGYVQIYAQILESPAYRDLTPLARGLFIEFYRLFRPNRNGRISLSLVNAAKLLRVNKNTVGRAFRELEAHGFIKMTNGYRWQAGQAREWRLTTERCDGREPTDDWVEWSNEKNPRS